MTWPTRPPVHDSALAICQRRFTRARPRRRAAASSSSSVGGRVIDAGRTVYTVYTVRFPYDSSVVRELQGDRVVERLEIGDDRLQLVPRLRRDAHCVSLDDRLRLWEALPDALRELLGLLAGEAAPEGDLLTHRAATGGLDPAPVEYLQRQAAPHRLGLEEVLRRPGAIVVIGRERERLLAQLEGDL